MSYTERQLAEMMKDSEAIAPDQMNSEDLSAAVSGAVGVIGMDRTGHVTVDRVPLEDEEQAAFVEWCRAHDAYYPGLDLLHSIPNGGYRPTRTGVTMKQTGLLPGVPDLFVPVPALVKVGKGTHSWHRNFHGLYIEMKRADPRLSRVDPHQADIIERLRAQGYYVAVAFGAAEAIDVVERYFRGEL